MNGFCVCPHDDDGPIEFKKEEKSSGVYDTAVQEGGSSDKKLHPELNKNMVQSIKSLREHRFVLPGDPEAARPETKLDESAAAESQFGGEGEYVDNMCNNEEFAKLTDLLERAKVAVEKGVSKPSIRSQVISKIKSATDLALYSAGDKGRLKVDRKTSGCILASSSWFQHVEYFKCRVEIFVTLARFQYCH